MTHEAIQPYVAPTAQQLQGAKICHLGARVESGFWIVDCWLRLAPDSTYPEPIVFTCISKPVSEVDKRGAVVGEALEELVAELRKSGVCEELP